MSSHFVQETPQRVAYGLNMSDVHRFRQRWYGCVCQTALGVVQYHTIMCVCRRLSKCFWQLYDFNNVIIVESVVERKRYIIYNCTVALICHSLNQ